MPDVWTREPLTGKLKRGFEIMRQQTRRLRFLRWCDQHPYLAWIGINAIFSFASRFVVSLVGSIVGGLLFPGNESLRTQQLMWIGSESWTGLAIVTLGLIQWIFLKRYLRRLSWLWAVSLLPGIILGWLTQSWGYERILAGELSKEIWGLCVGIAIGIGSTLGQATLLSTYQGRMRSLYWAFSNVVGWIIAGAVYYHFSFAIAEWIFYDEGWKLPLGIFEIAYAAICGGVVAISSSVSGIFVRDALQQEVS